MRIKQDDNGNFFVSETTNRNRDNYNDSTQQNNDSTQQNTADLFDEEKEKLQQCCNVLNNCFHIVGHSKGDEPQDTKTSFNDCVSDGMNAINNVASILGKNGQIIDKLKKKFKKTLIQKHKKSLKTLIQKKYDIHINEMSNNSNKIFRSDEKWWKRIKLGESHLFSTKATLKGKINALFREFVNSDVPNDNYERQFNALFSQLKQHKENKQKQREINNYDDKSIGLNTAFDNGHNSII